MHESKVDAKSKLLRLISDAAKRVTDPQLLVGLKNIAMNRVGLKIVIICEICVVPLGKEVEVRHHCY